MNLIDRTKLTAPIVAENNVYLREFKGNIFFRENFDIVRAIIIESSSYDKNSFYVSFFFFPLIVRSENMHLNFGNRLSTRNGERGWDADRSNVKDDLREMVNLVALPFLKSINDPMDAARWLKSHNSPNPQFRKAAAVCFARANKMPEALSEIDRLLPILDESSHWQVEIAREISLLRQCILSSAASVQALLDEWRCETIRLCKLEKVISS